MSDFGVVLNRVAEDEGYYFRLVYEDINEASACLDNGDEFAVIGLQYGGVELWRENGFGIFQKKYSELYGVDGDEEVYLGQGDYYYQYSEYIGCNKLIFKREFENHDLVNIDNKNFKLIYRDV